MELVIYLAFAYNILYTIIMSASNYMPFSTNSQYILKYMF